MLDNIKRKYNDESARQVEQNTQQMRRQSAMYQDFLTSGANDVSIPIPIGTMKPVTAFAEVENLNVPLEVTVWEASFGTETIRYAKKSDARKWLSQKRTIWENTGKVLRDRAIARAKLSRLYDRMTRVLCEIEEVVIDDTAGLLCNATEVVAIAIQTITEEGIQKTIAEVKRGQ